MCTITQVTAYILLIIGLAAAIATGYDIATAQEKYRAKVYPQHNVTLDPRLSGKIDRSATVKEEFELPHCLNGCFWFMNPEFSRKEVGSI